MSDKQQHIEKIRKLLAKANSTDSDAEKEAFYHKAEKLMEEHKISKTTIGNSYFVKSSELERIRREIDKLLSKKQDENTSIEECEELSRQIGKLLDDYNLEMADLRGEKGHELSKSIIQYYYPIYLHLKKVESTWVRTLISGLAAYNYCTIIGHPNGVYGVSDAPMVAIIGDAYCVQVVTNLTNSLIFRIRAEAGKAWKVYKGPEKRNTFRRGFLRGCAMGIREQLYLRQKAAKEENTNLPAIINKNQVAVDQFVRENYQSLKSSRSARLSSNDGSHSGFKTGKSMSIGSGVSLGSNNKGRLLS